MRRIHIIGRKNSGKTSLIVSLVDHYRRLGFRVGTIKHTHHQHELDTPGKDSYRHREGGAVAVGILAPTMNAIFWPRPSATSDPSPDDPVRSYKQFDALMADCDLVLVEGDQQATATKIEVWHRGLSEPPLAEQNNSISLVVTDDLLPELNTHSLSDLVSLCDRLIELAEIP